MVIWKLLLSTFFLVLLSNTVFCSSAKEGANEANIQFACSDSVDVDSMLAVATRLWEGRDPVSACAQANEAILCAQKKKYSTGLVSAYMLLAGFKSSDGFFAEAISFLEEAEEILAGTASKHLLVNALNEEGLVFMKMGDYNSGSKKLIEAIKICNSLNDEYAMADTYRSLSMIYRANQDYIGWVTNSKKEVLLRKKNGDKKNLAAALSTLGNGYKHTGDLENAVICASEALSVRREMGDIHGVTRSLHNIGELYYLQAEKMKFHEAADAILSANFSLAEKYLDSSLAAATIYGDTFMLAVNFLDKGELFFIMNKPKEAAKNASAALSYFKKIGQPENRMLCYKVIYRTDSVLSQYRSSFENYKQFVLLRDSMMNEETARKLTRQVMQYEFDKKEASDRIMQVKKDAIATEELHRHKLLAYAGIVFGAMMIALVMLTLRSFRLKRKNALIMAEVEKQNAVEGIRNRISRDMHDEIGSSLTKISLLSETLKSKMNETEAEGIVSKITTSSRGVIGNMSEIIWAINPVHDNLASMISYFRDYTSRFFEDTPVKCTIDFPEEVPEVSIAPELRRNLFLVLKESLNNILKHAFASNAYVEIKLPENQIMMMIKDNGTGFDMSSSKKFSNGIKNMKRRMEEVGGSFEITSMIGNTTARFNIPLE